MKKFISIIAATFMLTAVFGNDALSLKTDSCGSLEQWSIPPVKGKCPNITNAVMINGDLQCVVKCSYLQQEMQRKEKRKQKRTGQ